MHLPVDNVLSVVTLCRQPTRERWRQLRVDEKTHLINSQDRMIALPCSEFEDRRQVFCLDLGEVFENLFSVHRQQRI